jgi:hypothetical protein
MIIGINGKIGSGKDTVGKIIQYLVANKNLPKNMQYHSLEELDNGIEPYSNWKIKKFAGKLKTIGSLLTGVPVKKFENQAFKEQQMPTSWGMTYREFLQKLGTEAMRDGLHTNVWVNALFADYNPVAKLKGADILPNWCITDMRFPNEMEAVVARGGITIRVVRPDMNSLQAMVPAHASETALDEHTMHYDIINDGTIEDLIAKVKEILVKEKLL